MYQGIDTSGVRGLGANEIPLILRDPKDPARPLQLQRYQWDFATSPSYATYLAGGWFSGKSYALLQWLALRAYSNPPGTSGMVALPTHKMLKEFMSQYLLPAFGQGEDGIITGGNWEEGALYLKGNRRLLYRSAHEPKRIEVSDLCYVGADEIGLMKSEVFVRMVARTRDQRATLPFLGFTGVPIYGWLREEFDGRRDMQRRIIQIRSTDNQRVSKEALKNLLDACPARLRPCYIDGRFVPPGNRVYHSFTDNHVIDWRFDYYVQPMRRARVSSEVGVVIDPGLRTPHVLFVQVVPPGVDLGRGGITERATAIVIDELYPAGPDEDTIRTDELCEIIKAKGYPLRWCIMDPAGLTTEQTSGESVAEIVANALNLDVEYETDPDLRSIVNGVELVDRALKPAVGAPMLYFASTLEENENRRAVLRAIRAYCYPKDKEGKPLSDKPEKDGITDHAMDCLRYFFINRDEFIPLDWRSRITAYRAA
jgi:hypothetical protein